MPLSLPTLFRRRAPLMLAALSLAALAPAQALPLPGISDAVSRLFDSSNDLTSSPQGFSPQAFPLADGPVHEEWNVRWDGPDHSGDVATKVAVDRAGNVYVVGYSYLVQQSIDYRLVKYAPDGTELWNRRYDGPTHGTDQITGLTLDADGNAYVTGTSQSADLVYNDYATLKYAPDGQRLWVRRYKGTGDTEAKDIAVDTADNVFVTGVTETIYGENESYATLKYAPDGRTLWTRLYAGPAGSHSYSAAEALAVDAAGNAYVTGGANSAAGYPSGCFTIKYGPTGNPLWVRAADPNSTLDIGMAIAVAADGSVYVAGNSQHNHRLAYMIVKYGSDGTMMWRHLYGISHGDALATALAVDSMGNALVTGSAGTIKYGPDGLLKWDQAALGGFGNALAVDAAGSVYVAGNSGGDLQSDFSLVKYGADGRLHWGRFFDGPTHGSDSAKALALDDAGNVYVTGYSVDGGGTGSNMRTVKYSQ